ncbi:MAG TPA: hypothetical protein VJJ28_01235 [Candidatus Paceibacterota bacterium]
MQKTVSFNKNSLGIYTEEQIRQDWNVPGRVMGVNKGRCTIVKDISDLSRHVLEIKYPQGKVGQEENGGGAQWKHRFEKSYDKCTVEYQVMFPVSFDFVRGGKLPGFGGGTSPGGGKKSDGQDGFSTRIMWREQGEIFQYMYWMERAPEKRWGDDLPWTDINGNKNPFCFVPGQWHTLKTEIIMNTSGERDGEIVSWFDGKLALSCLGAFRAKGATFGIDNFNFTTFFGGNTLDWAPTKNEVLYFADFKITS